MDLGGGDLGETLDRAWGPGANRATSKDYGRVYTPDGLGCGRELCARGKAGASP